ncbi:hypothetical protein SAM40697_2884 [Streptomyces ambofaciens]|uniref:DUF485 domain-containing protein n=1 Tax=Streptomyces ambofaciens TaxID=1889 RepID=A0ABM6AX30_STRAM|nr:DUF485 domain-containing protein [Streptomyces ambofaciens]ANB06842.1 hypothetical protein SAM40697_2884 [Streptomyces ambofaciens]
MSYDPSPSYPHRPPPPSQQRPPYPPPLHAPAPSLHGALPWQPAEAPPYPPAAPAPTHRRAPRRAALGHHSDLRVLRSAYRWQRRTATLTALGYFTLFLLLSAYAPGFMTGSLVGTVPTGLLLALVQLPVTWLAIALYEHTARRRVDPLADRIRKEAALDARRRTAR